MNIQQLRYFCSVAHHGTFSRASEALRIAQPAITRQVQMLERELGTQLFNRRPRGVTVTDAGNLLLMRVEPILHSLEQIKVELTDMDSQPSGIMRIGCTPGLTEEFLMPPLQEFMANWPQVRINLQEHTSEALFKAVLTENLEAAIITAQADHSEIESHHLFSEPVLLCGPAEALQTSQEVSLQSEASLRRIIARKSLTTRDIIERLFVSENMFPNIAVETDSIHATAHLVATGHGFKVAPRLSMQKYINSGALSGAAIDGITIRRVLIHRRDVWITKSVQHFMAGIKRFSAKISENIISL